MKQAAQFRKWMDGKCPADERKDSKVSWEEWRQFFESVAASGVVEQWLQYMEARTIKPESLPAQIAAMRGRAGAAPPVPPGAEAAEAPSLSAVESKAAAAPPLPPATAVSQPFSRERVQMAYERIDTDGDGQITREELYAVLCPNHTDQGVDTSFADSLMAWMDDGEDNSSSPGQLLAAAMGETPAVAPKRKGTVDPAEWHAYFDWYVRNPAEGGAAEAERQLGYIEKCLGLM